MELLQQSLLELNNEFSAISRELQKKTAELEKLDDRLSIAKIESGKLNLEIKPGDFQEFVSQNIRINRIFADKKKISIRFKRLAKFSLVPFDRLKMEQVMNNLLSNAIRDRGYPMRIK